MVSRIDDNSRHWSGRHLKTQTVTWQDSWALVTTIGEFSANRPESQSHNQRSSSCDLSSDGKTFTEFFLTEQNRKLKEKLHEQPPIDNLDIAKRKHTNLAVVMHASKPFIVEGKERKDIPTLPHLWYNQRLRQ